MKIKDIIAHNNGVRVLVVEDCDEPEIESAVDLTVSEADEWQGKLEAAISGASKAAKIHAKAEAAAQKARERVLKKNGLLPSDAV